MFFSNPEIKQIFIEAFFKSNNFNKYIMIEYRRSLILDNKMLEHIEK